MLHVTGDESESDSRSTQTQQPPLYIHGTHTHTHTQSVGQQFSQEATLMEEEGTLAGPA